MFEQKNLSYRFEDWFCKERKIKSKNKPCFRKYLQDDELLGKHNTFFKNHDIFKIILKKIKRQWKHEVFCMQRLHSLLFRE